MSILLNSHSCVQLSWRWQYLEVGLTCLGLAWAWRERLRRQADGLTSSCWSNWCTWPLWCHQPACSWTGFCPVNIKLKVKPCWDPQEVNEQVHLTQEQGPSMVLFLHTELDLLAPYCVRRGSLFRSGVIDITANVELVRGEKVYRRLMESFKDGTWRAKKGLFRITITSTQQPTSTYQKKFFLRV